MNSRCSDRLSRAPAGATVDVSVGRLVSSDEHSAHSDLKDPVHSSLFDRFSRRI